ncbi:hypothetical protein [Pseudomonas laurylsulfatiphila]|uniref:hypothetical protein n=1 Tax=Pseudomonas laurylsulfatiphila TaxID=2011015 RepID=UPI001F0C3927|nr:hypothetical protein [Pseudomonas laurylsulfatiphila]
MNNLLPSLGLAIDSVLVVPNAPNYRPPCWPPKSDWPVVIDANGDVISRWGDSIWRLDPWAGVPLTLNFGDGPIKKMAAPIDHHNANLLRVIIGWWLYGPNGARGHRTLKTRFDQMRRLFALCSKEGVLASELSRFPRIADRIPEVLQSSRAREFLMLLHELYERRETLGFTILDRRALARLEASLPSHETRQTPFIPPRIWRYQVTRLHECLDDFLLHQKQIEACFRFCLHAYQHNRLTTQSDHRFSAVAPFQWPADGSNGRYSGRLFYGPFAETATRFGIAELLERWTEPSGATLSIRALSRYLTNVTRAGLAYLLNFSLMRVEECWNLRANCLRIETDPRFGEITLLRGRTTKTASDSDTFWVTSPSAKIAVEAMTAIATLRAEGSAFEPSTTPRPIEPTELYLVSCANEPWIAARKTMSTAIRPSIISYLSAFGNSSTIFDPEQLRITPRDLELARLVNPMLPEEFAVGEIWPLAWHQLRRTGAVNMQASGLVSDASLQFQLKHITRAMSFYYGQNFSRLRLEEKAHTLYVRTMYETLGRELQLLVTDRFISPHGEKRKAEIVRLILPSDMEKMTQLAKKGAAVYRPIILGVCSSREPCPYGGIDSIAHCGGGDIAGEVRPCPDVLYDRDRLGLVHELEQALDNRLSIATAGSPLKASLEAQKRSAENYRHVINQATPI